MRDQRLTAKDLQVYQFIVRYKKDHNGNAPSIREIGLFVDGSTSHISYILDKLVDFGYISRERFIARGITVNKRIING